MRASVGALFPLFIRKGQEVEGSSVLMILLISNTQSHFLYSNKRRLTERPPLSCIL